MLTQVPQPAASTEAPAFVSSSISPSRAAARYTCRDAGVMIMRTPLARRFPLRMAAACRISSSRPLVQVPINAKLIFWPLTSGTPTTSSIW